MMHPLFHKADQLSHEAIGAAIEVHRLKGPGLLESIYERCMMRELELRGLAAVHQQSVQEVLPIHKAQLLSYMKLLDVPIGLLINFYELKLRDGLSRMILPGANQ